VCFCLHQYVCCLWLGGRGFFEGGEEEGVGFTPSFLFDVCGIDLRALPRVETHSLEG
jgi:hypothetical protein